jgi:hypothetical protein
MPVTSHNIILSQHFLDVLQDSCRKQGTANANIGEVSKGMEICH